MGCERRRRPDPSRVAEVENYVKEAKSGRVLRTTVGEKMKPIVESTGVKFGGELYVDSCPKPTVTCRPIWIC
ncbi:hypothetical protein [Mobiluncus mulieris]|uniref:hypothetical protein n=1 Tax=Mobiluncus mulieris TaxID=2052 RepID=UPI0020927488|nr:hypothetical protein [Mobiluncus mulieris]